MEKNILVIGSGGREYIIIKRLYEDSILHNDNLNIFCLETNINTEIKKYAKIIKKYDNCNINDFLCSLINKYKFYLAIVGSEDFLLKGITDLLTSYNIPCMGPSKLNAQLETSKGFSRNFVENYSDLKIYNPKFNIYKNKKDFMNDLDNIFNKFSKFVIKKDGLYKGKGVFVENIDFERNKNSIDVLDIANSILIIEEKFVGEEFSLMSIIDYGNNINHFPPIRDYKRLNDNDEGGNTGGMGCIIDKNNSLPFLNSEDILECQNINKKVVNYLNTHNKSDNYRGILYGSFIKTKDGIKIIEFNCRFGDPEIIVALSLLKNNFWELCINYVNGSLKELQFSQNACICVYVVPKSYCSKNSKTDKYDIYFDDYNTIQNSIIYSNIEIVNNHTYSLGSRCFAIVNRDSNLYNCYHKCYKLLSGIYGNIRYRTDIGDNFLSKYEASGVCIEQSSKSLEEIKSYILSTYNNNVISDFGSFGGEIDISRNILKKSVLVCSIDGVGTKTVFSKKMKGVIGFINLGKDIVGHSINDILVQGANPLFFLDYYGCNNLNICELKNFIKGVSLECNKYNTPILGGETAEMPLVYNSKNVDLVGCIIGIKDNKYFKNSISSGDLILNIPSIGPHTNGFTLINKLINNSNFIDNDLINTLLEPHRCYYNEVKEFVEKIGYNYLHGMCHITGGGVHDNLKRILKNNNYEFYEDILERIYPNWCKKIQKLGNITNEEMYNVYNCGLGFLLIVNKNIIDKLDILSYEHYIIGNVL